MEVKKAKIGNALTSVAPDHVVAVAEDIYDELKGRYQSDINEDAVKAKVVADKAAADIGVNSITLLIGGINSDGSENTSNTYLRTGRYSTFKLEVNDGYSIGQLAQYDLVSNFVALYNDYTQIEGVEWTPTSVIATDKNYYWVAIVFKGSSPSNNNPIYPHEAVVKTFVSGLYYFMNGGENDPQSAARQAKMVVDRTIEQLPNTQDLVLVDEKMQLANRAAAVKDGKVANLGYIILRPDKSFVEQVVDANTIYEVRYEYNIDSNFSMPNNCSLKFNGGKIIINAKFGLNNVELSDSANILYIGENGSLFGNVKTPIKLSQVGVIGANDTEYNRKALQTLVDAGVKIIVDNSATFSDAIRIKTKINIEELIGKDTTLSFPNSKGFVWDASADSVYSPNNYVKGFTITSKDNCFDFYNEGGNRFRNIHQSSFIDLDCISSEGYCFYAGNNKGSEGDQLTFGNSWKNILIKAPLKSGFYGFDGIEDEFSDIRGSDCAIAHFENCDGRFVRCQGCFKKTTPHFLYARDTESRKYRLRCTFDNCNFEKYNPKNRGVDSKELAIIDLYSANVYAHLNFNGCSFIATINDTSEVESHLVSAYRLENLIWTNTRILYDKFAEGRTTICLYNIYDSSIISDRDLKVRCRSLETQDIPLVYKTISSGTQLVECATFAGENKPYSHYNGLKLDELYLTNINYEAIDAEFILSTMDNPSNPAALYVLNLPGSAQVYNLLPPDGERPSRIIQFKRANAVNPTQKEVILRNASTTAEIQFTTYVYGSTAVVTEGGGILSLFPGQSVKAVILARNSKSDTPLISGISADVGTLIYIDIPKMSYRKIGKSEQRPTGVDTSFQYFDTTLSKPIWWTGEKWVDSTGAAV